jgi:hypothetical protein
VEPIESVPDGAFGCVGGEGELAGGHHPVLVEQDQQHM